MTKKIAIGLLGSLSVLLLAAFFVVYLTGNDTQPVELTAGQPEPAGAGPETTVSSDETGQHTDSLDATENPEGRLRVYVAGEVDRPGVYPLLEGDRLVDAVKAAGGPTDAADLEMVNLAARVEDEGYYYIPPIEEVPDAGKGADAATAAGSEPGFPVLSPNASAMTADGRSGGSQGELVETSGLINLNTATQAELETLPGIGPARSRAIIAYREQNGPYIAVEEITAVSGIGQGTLDSLRGLVTVGNAP